LKSRYFPHLFESIKNKKNIFFVPNITIFKFLDFIKNLILLRRENIYLLKEDYISYLDVFSIFNINSKMKNIFKKRIFVKDFFLTDLIVEELLNQKNTFGYLESYINFLFLKMNIYLQLDNLSYYFIHFETACFANSLCAVFDGCWSNAVPSLFLLSPVTYLSLNGRLSSDHSVIPP